MKTPTLTGLKREIARLDPALKEGERAYTTYLILLSSLVCGPNVQKIAKFAHIPREQVAKRGVNLRKNGVWVRGKIRADWFVEDGSGGCAFVADALVADGMLERRPA
jgi:hypothetical protein